MTVSRALLMWKNTDASGDFWCDCGAECSWGGEYCNYLRCPKCRAIYKMPSEFFPEKVTETEYDIEPVMMEGYE